MPEWAGDRFNKNLLYLKYETFLNTRPKYGQRLCSASLDGWQHQDEASRVVVSSS